MKIFITKNKKTGDKTALGIIKKQLLKKPSSLIGFAAGKTTDGLYKLISKDVIRNPKKWKAIKIFQIDEILGIGPESPLSFNFEIRRELENLINVLSPGNIFLINGTIPPKKTIKKAYEFINKNKGIDLIILGIGPKHDPHIAYNTTSESTLNSRIRVVRLHEKISTKLKGTKRVKDVKGITIGIKDILECKKALLIAYGKDKVKSLKLALHRKVDMKKASASALQLHKDLYVVVDKEAVGKNNVK